jgi:2-iminobutanoate/2-iminopropanoate deaminase
MRVIVDTTKDNIPNTMPFSPFRKAGPLFFVSGQASVDDTGKIVPDTFRGEMQRSMKNIIRILADEGLTLRDVVQSRCYLGSVTDIEEYNLLYRQYFQDPLPARTTLVECLGTLLKFEIDVVAFHEGK